MDLRRGALMNNPEKTRGAPSGPRNGLHTCECGSCEKPEDERNMREAFIAEIHTVGVKAGPGFWEAWSQGKLAALENRPITDNPWRDSSHVNCFEYERGYRSVALQVFP